MIIIKQTLEQEMMEDFLRELSECDTLSNSVDPIHKNRALVRRIIVLASIEQLKKLEERKKLGDNTPPITGGYHSQELARFNDTMREIQGKLNGHKIIIQPFQNY